jgi:hypothetical protein
MKQVYLYCKKTYGKFAEFRQIQMKYGKTFARLHTILVAWDCSSTGLLALTRRQRVTARWRT